MTPAKPGTGMLARVRKRAPLVRAPRAWREAKSRRFRRRMAGPKLIEAFAGAYPEAFFIEIGSNDGDQHDHLRPMIRSRGWAGIMVEPVPYVFERLRRNYGDLARVSLENAAIADHDGRLPFYHLAQAGEEDRDGLPDWYDAIGSFSRDVVLGHIADIPDVERRLVSVEVPCLTFESLCAKHRVGEIDLLLIDTEGYDYEILKQIDFETRRPRLLVYEHYHLRPDERVSSRARLHDVGYETLEEGFDTWCLRTGEDDALARSWRGTRPGIPAISAHDE